MNKLKNKIISLIKIWYRDSMVNITAKHFFESFIEHIVCYWFFYAILDSIYLALLAILITNYIKYINKNILINKQKLLSGEFDLYLLRPSSQLIMTAVYELSIVDAAFSILIIMIMIVIYGNYLLITASVLILITTLYLISRSLLVLNNKYIILENLPLLAVLFVSSLIYRSLMIYGINLWLQIVLVLFSLIVFYLSISLWQKVIQKYIRR